MSQKFRDLSLFRESNLFNTVECFELVKIDKYTCDVVEFRTSERVMKSKLKVPQLVYSRYGSSMKEVSNIDFSVVIRPTTLFKYRNDRKRQGYIPEHVYYLKDGYLYLPDSEVSRVSLYLYTPNLYEAEKKSSCAAQCLNPWDFEFVCSDKIEELVIQEVIKELSMKVQIPVDENPNLDSNLKSKTTN